MWRKDTRGVSKVVGTVLLIAIVLLLGATLGATVGQFVSETPEPKTYAGVEIDADQRTAFIETTSVQARSDELDILVNGKKQRTWSDFSAGSRLPLFCLKPGDTVTVRDSGEDGNSATVATHVMQQRSSCKFAVSQPSLGTKTATPINWQSPGASPDSFYSYGRGPNGDGTGHYHAHLDPGFVSSEESYMFFYEFSGEVALIFVHDSPDGGHGDHSETNAVSGSDNYDDTNGGAVDLKLDGEPSEASWVVKDDASDFQAAVDGNSGCATTRDVCWDWAQTNTDGGILSGGFKGDLSSLNMEVKMYWNDDAGHWQRTGGWDYENMDKWVLYSGTKDGGVKRIELEMSEEATITTADG